MLMLLKIKIIKIKIKRALWKFNYQSRLHRAITTDVDELGG